MRSVAEWPTGEWVVDPATQVEWPVPEGVPEARVIEHARRADAGELRTIRFFPEYGCETPLWGEGGPADPEEYGLSVGLAADLRAWTSFWLTRFDPFEGWDDGVDVAAWEREGTRLARRVQIEGYDSVRVLSSFE